MRSQEGRIRIGDDGVCYGLGPGDGVEFAMSEMDGVASGRVVKVFSDGYYAVSVDGGPGSRELYETLSATKRHAITGSPGGLGGWTVELDGTAITRAWELAGR